MIGANIASAMHEKGLTQATLAKMASMSQGSLSDIVSGKAEPRAETVRRIAYALGMDAEELKNLRKNYTPNVCPRCGSRSVTEWTNYGKGSCRIRCNYCELDTGEQANRGRALSIFESFEAPQKARRASESVRVLLLSELLDSACFDTEAVRPVWFENRGLFIVPSLLQSGIAEREQNLVRVWWWNSNGHKSFMLDQYCKWWRCWSDKPTEAVSDSIPWED